MSNSRKNTTKNLRNVCGTHELQQRTSDRGCGREPRQYKQDLPPVGEIRSGGHKAKAGPVAGRAQQLCKRVAELEAENYIFIQYKVCPLCRRKKQA